MTSQQQSEANGGIVAATRLARLGVHLHLHLARRRRHTGIHPIEVAGTELRTGHWRGG